MVTFNDLVIGSTVNIDLNYLSENNENIDLDDCKVSYCLSNESDGRTLLRDIESEPNNIINISDKITNSLNGWYELKIKIIDNDFVDIHFARLQFNKGGTQK